MYTSKFQLKKINIVFDIYERIAQFARTP